MMKPIVLTGALLLATHVAIGEPLDLTGDGVVDHADVQVLLARVTSGVVSYDAAFDMNGDAKLDLVDVLQFGQWINGLYHAPTFPTLYLSNQADTTAYAGYQRNLLARKGVWTRADLVSRYPDVSVAQGLNYDRQKVEYIDSLTKRLRAGFLGRPDSAASDQFVARTLERGVAVYGATRFPNYHTAYDAIHSADLPVIVTTDMLLETVYRSYDNLLMQLETDRFSALLNDILSRSLAYSQRYYQDSAYVTDVRDYLATALFLLNPARTDLAKSTQVASWLAAASSEAMNRITLFGRPVVVDFSQFKPRGHYTKSVVLTNYFRAMMWLSRADLSLEIGGPIPLDMPARVLQKKAALVLWDCVVSSGTYAQWISFNNVIDFMVGQSDGLSVRGMGGLVRDLEPAGVPALLANFDESRFDSVAARNQYGVQLILSQFKPYDLHPSDSLSLPLIFSFMPQRFVLDSYTFSQSVFPLVDYRELPSSLDIAFVLGDNSALADYPAADMALAALPGILGSQRRLYDDISEPGWQSNLYTCWLDFLRKLNGAEKNPALSPVFRTSSWRAKMRNTQLTSWAQLRHNTILYAKQSYTGGITCDHPLAYVEPYPDFFEGVEKYATKAKNFFGKVDHQVGAYFSSVQGIAGKLKACAQLTAQGKEPTADQVAWLKQVVVPTYKSVGCGTVKVLDGWYFDLVYDIPDPNVTEQSSFSTIADVHTRPADDIGPAKVLHAASGLVNLMAVVVELDTCTSVFVGPVGSYYDVVTVDPNSPVRLTDEEWTTALDSSSAWVVRPQWASRFVSP